MGTLEAADLPGGFVFGIDFGGELGAIAEDDDDAFPFVGALFDGSGDAE